MDKVYFDNTIGRVAVLEVKAQNTSEHVKKEESLHDEFTDVNI